jgi:8-oxo-dGTP diphosphatase
MHLSPTTHVLARAIIIHKDHILLCRTIGLNYNFYFTPGGHIEPTETAKQALHRELLEEIGFNFTIKRFLACIEYCFQPNEITNMHCHTQEYNFFFEATAKEIELQIPIPKLEQHIDLIWVQVKDLLSIDLKPEALKQFINLWLNQHADHMFIPYK